MAKTYEMLWDCQFCGTKKLLGKSHRFCPNCGAPQDASARYFPSDAEKVAVEDHVFCGADRICPSCQVASSATAKHCGSCGSALDAAKSVATRADQVGDTFAGETAKDAKAERAAAKAAAQSPSGAASKPVAKSKKGWFIGGGIVAALAALVFVLTLTQETTVKVTGHSWSREIVVEKFGPVPDSAWCDQMPRDGYNVSRSREVRSHNKVPDGEVCHTRRHDNGDGTFSESEECKTKYRDEPVYSDKCHYTVDRWKPSRTASAKGSSLVPAPGWPAVNLVRTGTCIGCEREGPRSEDYAVALVDAKGKSHSCSYPQARWEKLAVGSAFTADIGTVTGILSCDSLRTPGAPKP